MKCLALLLLPATAFAQIDLMECASIAGRFHDQPTTLTIADLDQLEVCAATIKAMKVQAGQAEKDERGIASSFGLDDKRVGRK